MRFKKIHRNILGKSAEEIYNEVNSLKWRPFAQHAEEFNDHIFIEEQFLHNFNTDNAKQKIQSFFDYLKPRNYIKA